MANEAVIITLPGSSPDPTAPLHINHVGVIGARPSLQTWQDPSRAESFTTVDGAVSRWNSRVGSGYYEQATAANRPTRTTAGAQNNVPFLQFDGTTDRMAPNGIASINPANGFSVLAVVKPTLYDVARYLFGQGATDDNIFLQTVSTGNFRFSVGSQTINAAHTANTWAPVLVSSNGAGKRARLIVDGLLYAATVVTSPTTSRALSMGATSTQANSGLWSGGIADWMYFAEDVTDDPAFLSVLSQYVRAKYAFGYEPFVVT